MGRKKKTDYPERLVRLIAACNELNVGDIPSPIVEDLHYRFDPYPGSETLPKTIKDFIAWDRYGLAYETVDKTIRVSRSQSRQIQITWGDVLDLLDDKQMLRQIVSAFDEYQQTPNLPFEFLTFFAVGSVAVSFHPDSTLKLASSRALEILVHQKVPVKRVRICRECGDLYLMKRVTTQYCMKTKCRTAYHNRVRSNRRDREELEMLRDQYRRTRVKWNEHQGSSNWQAKKREEIEQELEDIKDRGLKVRGRIESRQRRRADYAWTA